MPANCSYRQAKLDNTRYSANINFSTLSRPHTAVIPSVRTENIKNCTFEHMTDKIFLCPPSETSSPQSGCARTAPVFDGLKTTQLLAVLVKTSVTTASIPTKFCSTKRPQSFDVDDTSGAKFAIYDCLVIIVVVIVVVVRRRVGVLSPSCTGHVATQRNATLECLSSHRPAKYV